MIEKHKIIITYQIYEDETLESLEIPKNKLLVDRLKDYKSKYNLIFKLTE